jgi:hypothetical protein
MEALRLAMLREADRQQVGDPIGFANTAGWWATVARTTKPEAHRQVRLATAVDREEHAAVREAMSRGEVSTAQAAVIVRSVEELPEGLVEPAVRQVAEKNLVALAEHHDPRELRILGRKILEVSAPEVADAALARVLEAEERRAEETASFTMRPDGHGSMVGRFKIPLLAGRILEKHLNAIAAPRHVAATGGAQGGRVARPLRWGAAFVEYLRTRPDPGTPKAGGMAASVVVTMSLDSLLGDLKAAALLDTGEQISAAHARQLVCEAGLYPAVVGSRSQVLDLGRKTRLHTEPMRIAIAVRDKTCRAEHCDWPPGMCHVHHPDPWARGGGTSVGNGALLCPRHHAIAHDPRYQAVELPHGRFRYVMRG